MKKNTQNFSGLTIKEHEKAEVRRCAKEILVDLDKARALLIDCPPEKMQERAFEAALIMKKIADDAGQLVSRHRVNAQTIIH